MGDVGNQIITLGISVEDRESNLVNSMATIGRKIGRTGKAVKRRGE